MYKSTSLQSTPPSPISSSFSSVSSTLSRASSLTDYSFSSPKLAGKFEDDPLHYLRPREIVWANIDGQGWKLAVVKSGPHVNIHTKSQICPLRTASSFMDITFWRVHMIDDTEHVWAFWVSPSLYNVLPDTPLVRDYLRWKGDIALSNVALSRGIPRILRSYLQKPDSSTICVYCRYGETRYWEHVFRSCATGNSSCLGCTEKRTVAEPGLWPSGLRP